jgi:hypothetical protein
VRTTDVASNVIATPEFIDSKKKPGTKGRRRYVIVDQPLLAVRKWVAFPMLP